MTTWNKETKGKEFGASTVRSYIELAVHASLSPVFCPASYLLLAYQSCLGYIIVHIKEIPQSLSGLPTEKEKRFQLPRLASKGGSGIKNRFVFQGELSTAFLVLWHWLIPQILDQGLTCYRMKSQGAYKIQTRNSVSAKYSFFQYHRYLEKA